MHRLVMRVSTAMAMAGGAMLLALVLLVCASVAGRELNEILREGWLAGTAFADWAVNGLGLGSIDGDFELVEAGMAFVIFAFLPLTQATVGHASVDLFAERLPRAVDRWLGAVIEAVFAAVLILIAVQLWGGLQTKLAAGQVTIRLGFPIWWAYALAMVPAVLAALVGVWCAWARLVEAATGRVILVRDGPLTETGRADR